MTLALTALGIGGVAVLLALGGLYATDQVGSRVTKIERTPCYKAPASDACQRTKRRSDEAQNRSDACIPFEKVDKDGRLLRLTRCQGIGRGTEAPASSRGGDALQPDSTGTQPSGPSGGLGQADADNPIHGGEDNSPPHKGGSGGGAPTGNPAPTNQSPAPVSEFANDATDGPSLAPVLDGTKDAVGDVTDGVKGTLESVPKCGLLQPC